MRATIAGWIIQGSLGVAGSPQCCTHRACTSDLFSQGTSSMLISGASVLARRSSMYGSPLTSQTRPLNSASVISAITHPKQLTVAVETFMPSSARDDEGDHTCH